MELKRKYREVLSTDGDSKNVIVKPNDFFRRNLSLTGLYYHLSKYGENLLRPSLIGIAIVFVSTLFWSMQSNPTLQPTFSTNAHLQFSNFTALAKTGDLTHWKETFERDIADFIPLLPLGGKIEVGLADYVFKLIGGALTFGLLAIALRRKFERRFRH